MSPSHIRVGSPNATRTVPSNPEQSKYHQRHGPPPSVSIQPGGHGPASTPAVIALIVVRGFVWGGLPLSLQTWMATASPPGRRPVSPYSSPRSSSLSAGSILYGVAVTSFGLDQDFRLAGAVADRAHRYPRVRHAGLAKHSDRSQRESLRRGPFKPGPEFDAEPETRTTPKE